MYASTVGKARCPVCSTGLENGQITTCPRCLTPHHADCWEYVNGCSIYGCQAVKKSVVFRTLAEAADDNSIGFRRIKDWFSLIVLQWFALYGIVSAFSVLVQLPFFNTIMPKQEFDLLTLALMIFALASCLLYLITLLPRLSAWCHLRSMLKKPRVHIRRSIQLVDWVDRDGWHSIGDRLLLLQGLISFLVFLGNYASNPAKVTDYGYCVILSILIVILGCKASADRYAELKRVQTLVDDWQTGP